MRTKALLRSEALRPAKVERGSPRTQSEEKEARSRNLVAMAGVSKRLMKRMRLSRVSLLVGDRTYLVAPMREMQRNAKMVSRKKERESDKVGERAWIGLQEEEEEEKGRQSVHAVHLLVPPWMSLSRDTVQDKGSNRRTPWHLALRVARWAGSP